MAARPEFVLIDGHAVAYRQFFALPVRGFSTSSGEPTNATYGFTRILLDMIQNERPRYLAVSFDMGMSGRDEWYAEYKGTREKMPEELAIQLDRIDEVVRTFNIPVLKVEGYEADDIIGTVVHQVRERELNVDVRIITGDRDILQLLGSQVRVQLPQRGKKPDLVYDVDLFREKYGLEPGQLVDLKALQGDSSDNIPGVRGIGEKGGTKLLQQYQTLDGIYEHLDEIKGASHKNLVAGREMAYLSQKLAQIQIDAPVDLNLTACMTQDFDVREVDALFGELEFRQLRSRLNLNDMSQLPLFALADEDAGHGETEQIVPTIIVQSEDGLSQLVDLLNQAEMITWDVETTSVNQMACDLVGIALAVDGETGYYIPVGHNEGTQLPLKTVIDALRDPLTNPRIAKSAHNAAFDLVVMRRYGIDVRPVMFDTMIAEWVIDPISRFLGLKALVRQRLDIHMTDISALIGKGKKQITMAEVAIERAAPYAAADAALTHRLISELKPQLEQNQALDLFRSLEMPLIPVVAAMEQAGVVVDAAYLREMSGQLAEQLATLEQEIYSYNANNAFNINSPKQLNEVLFDTLKLPVEGLRKTTHGYSTDAVTLDILKDKHPIVQRILDYRELSKLKSTYVDALPQLINPVTGRIHTSFNQTGTSTGRFSSSDPNLQNIPIRTEQGRAIRRAFVAPRDHLLLAVDYSQVELRVMAHISGDAGLLNAFREGQDIHRATAAAVHGVTPDEVTYEQRSFAKRVNFGLMYGMGAFRLSRDSDLTLGEAESFVETYFERFPGVKTYIDETKKRAREQGYVETLLGRRRYFPVLHSGRTGQTAAAEERAAINMPIQGTAADILKQAMLNLYDELNRQQFAARMILQVHDELVLEVSEAEFDPVVKLVVETMESAYTLDVPLKANAQVGPNWLDMSDV